MTVAHKICEVSRYFQEEVGRLLSHESYDFTVRQILHETRTSSLSSASIAVVLESMSVTNWLGDGYK
jgi:hypothetical protein